jgi:hypothetical protein
MTASGFYSKYNPMNHMRRLRLVILLLISSTLAACSDPEGKLPVDAESFYDGIYAVDYHLRNFANDHEGRVYGSMGTELHRIVDDGNRSEPVHRFPQKINGIHVTRSGNIIVSTDDDHWDPDSVCKVFRSNDGGENFELIKTIKGGSALWWSISSDKAGNLYVGEYGPHHPDMSKTVWKLPPDDSEWKEIFKAPNNKRAHIHRVAVDPFTDALWVSVGDGRKNAGIHRSLDQGEHWENVLDSQATGAGFTPDAIYWGEDAQDDGIITRYQRSNEQTTVVLEASGRGNFGGSIYSLAVGRAGYVYAAMMKYPDQLHAASLWAGKDGDWRLLLRLASTKEKGVGVETIGGPDLDGWMYISGYKFKDLEQD